VSVGVLLGAAAAAGLASAEAPHGDPVRGERVFQRCYACHSVDPKETARLQGPTLYRVIGRGAGAVDGFEYSEALRKLAAARLVWSPAALDAYLADPDDFAPGTSMSMPPLREPGDRADVIAYLRRAGR